MESRVHATVRRRRTCLSVALQVVIALATVLLSLSAHAQDFCDPGEVPVAFGCGYGNASLNVNTTPCYSKSITAIEAGLQACAANHLMRDRMVA